MRISDWSSDVCSSDLTERTRLFHRSASATLTLTPAWRLSTGSAAARLPEGTSNARSSAAIACAGRAIAAPATNRERKPRVISAHQHPAIALPLGQRSREGRELGHCPRAIAIYDQRAPKAEPFGIEIGKASCRERVGQYVES